MVINQTVLCIQFGRQEVSLTRPLPVGVKYHCKMDEKNSTVVNSTSEDVLFASVLGVPGYFAVNGLSIALVCGVGGTLNAVLLVALLCNRHLKKLATLQPILFNIAVAGLVTTAALAMLNVSRMLALVHLLEEATYACRTINALLHVSTGMRTLLLLTISVTIFITIKYGAKKIKVFPLCISLVIMWVIEIASAVPYFTAVYDIETFLDGVNCITQLNSLSYGHVAVSIALGDMPSRIIAVVMVICTAVHIRKNTITEETTMKRAMIRFAVLLLLMNFVTLFGIALPAVHFVLPNLVTPTTYVILKTFTYIFLCIPVIATPVLMMAIFKPVSKAVKEVVTCKSCVKRVRTSKGQPESSSSGQAPNSTSATTGSTEL